MSPKDCKNSKLLITESIIEGYRSWFPTLNGNVSSHLTLAIKAKKHAIHAAKRTIDNTSSTPGRHAGKRHQTGKSSWTMTGRSLLLDRKVVGTIEDQYYSKDVGKSMSSEQKAWVLLFCKTKSTTHAVMAINTAGSGYVSMDISGRLAVFMNAI